MFKGFGRMVGYLFANALDSKDRPRVKRKCKLEGFQGFVDLWNYTVNFIWGSKPTVAMSFMFTPFIFLFDKTISDFTNWTIDNHLYLTWIIIAIFLDYVFGTILHAKEHFQRKEGEESKWSWSQNIFGTMLKSALIVGVMILGEGFAHFVKEVPNVILVLSILVHTVVFLYPTISAMENIWILSGKKFPPEALIERLKNIYNNPSKKTIEEVVEKDEK